MSFLLDTNVISEVRKHERANEGVRTWFESVDDQDIRLSVLVVGELRRGVERIRRRDTAAAGRLDSWLQNLTSAYSARILPVTSEIAEVWGRLSVPDPLPVVDGLLAATAVAHGLTFVTRNERDVARSGVSILNPFT